MNGLFTVVGGLLSVIVSMIWGFNVAIISALLLYVLAFAMYRKLHIGSVPAAARVATNPG
jgi:hypothetical protein